MNITEIIANALVVLSMISLIVAFVYLQSLANGVARFLIITGGLIAFSPLILELFVMLQIDHREQIEIFFNSLRFFGLLVLSIGIIIFSMKRIEPEQ